MSDSELQHLAFCSHCCEVVINTKKEFHMTVNSQVLIFQIKYPQDDYNLDRYIDQYSLWELYDAGLLRCLSDEMDEEKICGNCIESLRPYIHYFSTQCKNLDMFILLPYDFDSSTFIGSDDEDFTSDED